MNDLNTPTRIYTLELGPMENFVYIIEDTQSKRAAVVDPAWEPTAILDLAKQQGLTITDILLTHSHHDHINAVDNILFEFDAEMHLTHAEAEFWGHAGSHPSLHHGGDRLSLARELANSDLSSIKETAQYAVFHVVDLWWRTCGW